MIRWAIMVSCVLLLAACSSDPRGPYAEAQGGTGAAGSGGQGGTGAAGSGGQGGTGAAGGGGAGACKLGSSLIGYCVLQ
jgi:hypothetical protein